MGDKRTRGSLLARAAVLMVVGLALLGGCASPAVRSTRAFPEATGFTRHEITVDGRKHVVWVFVPKDYVQGRRYPSILFLHGLFEAGTGGENCLSGGLGPVIAEKPEAWKFITVFPQSTGTWRGEERDRLAMAALDFAVSKWSIDQNRVILAGLSYGGLGVWEIGARHPERFAALVPVSGHKHTEPIERLVLLPVWAFSYKSDPWVQAENSEEMCTEISKRGGLAKLTEFLGVGHDAWGKAVHNSELVDWMLRQRRHPVAPSAPMGVAAVAKIE